jgi:hypothetical protein
MLGALFGASPRKPEDIVFEPIDVPDRAHASGTEIAMEGSPSVVLPEVQTLKKDPPPGPLVPNRPAKGPPRTVALGELMPLVPSAWKRSAHFAPEQTIELPAEARLDMGVERPLAFSLRYLAKAHPQWFRDPGPYETDLGVDLWMEPLRDPEASPAEMDVPAELVAEAAEERDSFLQWEGEQRSSREIRKEERETQKALRSVKMPPLLMRVEGGFEDLLRMPAEASSPAQMPPKKAAASNALTPNPRLRKILEAYADGLSDAKSPPQPQGPAPVGSSELLPAAEPMADGPRPPGTNPGPPVRWGQAVSKQELASPPKPDVPAALGGYEMRFEELGLSLSKFSEVRGFGLWQGGVAQHTGDLGFDARNEVAREKLERILDDALSTQGAQDGFLSVTVHHARGGISVFGGGSCLVAVAHHADGLPAHLRSWLCGWVSQPLRG